MGPAGLESLVLSQEACSLQGCGGEGVFDEIKARGSCRAGPVRALSWKDRIKGKRQGLETQGRCRT